MVPRAIAWAGACTLAAYLVGGRLQSLSGTIDLIIVGTAGLILATAAYPSPAGKQARPAGRSRLPRLAQLTVRSRVRPKAAAGGEPTRRTILRSISLTADAITAAALVMVCVFALFGTPNGVAGLARSVRLGVVG